LNNPRPLRITAILTANITEFFRPPGYRKPAAFQAPAAAIDDEILPSTFDRKMPAFFRAATKPRPVASHKSVRALF
jgi:hypothetical protein